VLCQWKSGNPRLPLRKDDLSLIELLDASLHAAPLLGSHWGYMLSHKRAGAWATL